VVFELVARIEEILLAIVAVVQGELHGDHPATNAVCGVDTIAVRVCPSAPGEVPLRQVVGVTPGTVVDQIITPGAVRAWL